jgi:hypothetical protein
MFNKKSFIILLLVLHITISLKSSEFCVIKQKVCKGFYDRLQKYQIECSIKECYGKFNISCGKNICSSNLNKCDEINKINLYTKITNELKAFDPIFAGKYSKERRKVYMFNKQIKYCENQIYEYSSNDFCLDGNKCRTTLGYGYLKMIKKSDCICPKNKTFKCGKYCAIDSIACDFYTTHKNETNIGIIKDCGNNNSSYFKSYFSIF